MKNGIIEYEISNGFLPKTVLINIPRCYTKRISYGGLEQVKDMFFYSGKYKGGMVCGANPHVIVFANKPPKRHMMSEDRWNIVEIGGKDKKDTIPNIVLDNSSFESSSDEDNTEDSPVNVFTLNFN